MKTTTEVIGATVAALGVLFLLSAMPAAMWFCFDDTFAEAFNCPALGSLPFWPVYAACLFVRLCFGSGSVRLNENKH